MGIVQVMNGQIVYEKLSTKLEPIEFAKFKAHIWLHLLNEGMKPKKWLKPTSKGSKVNWDSIKSQEDYDGGLDELQLYLNDINKQFNLDFNLKR